MAKSKNVQNFNLAPILKKVRKVMYFLKKSGENLKNRKVSKYVSPDPTLVVLFENIKNAGS